MEGQISESSKEFDYIRRKCVEVGLNPNKMGFGMPQKQSTIYSLQGNDFDLLEVSAITKISAYKDDFAEFWAAFKNSNYCEKFFYEDGDILGDAEKDREALVKAWKEAKNASR